MIKLPVYFTSYKRRRDRTLSLGFATQELSSDAVREIDEMVSKEELGWLVFDPNDIRIDDIPEYEAPDVSKTPAQRLRASLFVWWKQQGELGDFEVFYREKMEKLIELVKSKLDGI